MEVKRVTCFLALVVLISLIVFYPTPVSFFKRVTPEKIFNPTPKKAGITKKVKIEDLGLSSVCPFNPKGIISSENSIPFASLPGYSGWYRPTAPYTHYYVLYTGPPVETSKPNFFHLDGTIYHDLNKNGTRWSTIIRCTKCNKHAFFYARAYGPSIIVGRPRLLEATGEENLYEITFNLLTPGVYTVEVVIEMESDTDNVFTKLPLKNNEPSPQYLGFILPDFPLKLNVSGHRGLRKNQPCTMEQLTKEDNGEWQIRGRVGSMLDVSSLPSDKFQNYRTGFSRLGFCADWVSDDGCSITPMKDLVAPDDRNIGSALNQCLNVSDTHTLHLIFIGDSVMGQTFDITRNKLLVEATGQIKMHTIDVRGGLAAPTHNVSEKLRALRSLPGKHIIIFNSGLHDTDKLCIRSWKRWRVAHNISEPKSCLSLYKRLFEKFVDTIVSYKADATIFRTTSAGWVRWGNFGFNWGNGVQNPIASPHYITLMNKEALDIVQQSKNDIQVLDNFWLTYPRPDDTQIQKDGSTGAHLVHPGEPIAAVSIRKIFMMIMWNICPHHLEHLSPSS